MAVNGWADPVSAVLSATVKVDKVDNCQDDRVVTMTNGLARAPRHRQRRSVPPSHAALLEVIAAELADRDPEGTAVAKIVDPGVVARSLAGTAVDTAARWDEHLGGFYDVEAVRQLLSRDGGPVSRQAVSKRRGLLALTTGSGRVVYPVAQFRGSSVLPGMGEVLTVLPERLVSRWTVASWLVSEQIDLHHQVPVDLLRESVVAPVVAAARRWASALAA